MRCQTAKQQQSGTGVELRGSRQTPRCRRFAWHQQHRWHGTTTRHAVEVDTDGKPEVQLSARLRRMGRADIIREFEQGLVSSADFEDPFDAQHAGACDFGLPDTEICDGLITPPAELSVAQEAWSRGRWLLGLLVLQSSSSFILDRYEALIREHLFITLFLTMLVGAGGNAGNQSAIKVIRGLATETIQPTTASLRRVLKQQGSVGLLLAVGLSAAGSARVLLTSHDPLAAIAIGCSLFAIVMTSVMLGSLLPFGFANLGVDPAHAGTSIQVVMDILGVAISCTCSTLVLDQLSAGLGGG